MSFNEFIMLLGNQISKGNFKVYVDCANNKSYLATVTGYDSFYESIFVTYESDNLLKEQWVEEKIPGLYIDGAKIHTQNVFKNAPIKNDKIDNKHIRLTS